jgi:methionine biosynthesis protein MetW
MTVRPKYHIDAPALAIESHPDDAHSILVGLVPPGSTVLELGCASGYLSSYLETEKKCRVTGLEADPVAVEIARTRCSEVHLVDLDDPAALSVVRGPFQVLLAAAVLEHLKTPEQLLRNLHSKLAPGATVIVSLPNVAHRSVRFNLLRGKFEYADYGIMDRTHVHFYTNATARALLEDCGYAINALYISGSGLQNLLNQMARRLAKPLLKPIWPEFLAYELIYLATPTSV